MHPRAFRLSDGWLCLLPITCPCAIEVFSSRQIVRLDSVHLAPLLQLFTEKCRREFEGQYRVFFVLRMLRASKHKWIKYGITCNTKIFLLHKKMHYKHDKHECWYEVGKTVTVADSGGGVRTPPPNLGYFFFLQVSIIYKIWNWLHIPIVYKGVKYTTKLRENHVSLTQTVTIHRLINYF